MDIKFILKYVGFNLLLILSLPITAIMTIALFPTMFYIGLGFPLLFYGVPVLIEDAWNKYKEGWAILPRILIIVHIIVGLVCTLLPVFYLDD